MNKSRLAIAVIATLAAVAIAAQMRRADPEWTVKIEGGYETDERDRGRPGNLVAGG